MSPAKNIAAVSVRKRFWESLIALNPFCLSRLYSFSVKSPTGPMTAKISLNFLFIFLVLRLKTLRILNQNPADQYHLRQQVH